MLRLLLASVTLCGWVLCLAQVTGLGGRAYGLFWHTPDLPGLLISTLFLTTALMSVEVTRQWQRRRLHR